MGRRSAGPESAAGPIVAVTATGTAGRTWQDRRLALLHRETGRVASAKNRTGGGR
ncbi:hypothetical protein [Micromonospora chersina]|uniref:hypothetical protein n=1 Tax=Micromonospora chersina TaxID=47854 RepID=UPI0033FD06B1